VFGQTASEMENIYNEVLSSGNIDIITSYIRTYRRNEHFNNDSYLEIARLLTHNNIAFTKIYRVLRTSEFNSETVYFCDVLRLSQRLDQSVVVYIFSNIVAGPVLDQNVIIIKNGNIIENHQDIIYSAFLKYINHTPFRLNNGRTIELPVYELLYCFDIR
jgi:hypothetical protein